MGLLVWAIVGGVVGWVASLIMKTDGQQGIILNVVVGIAGAFLAGFLLSPMLGIGTINSALSVGTFAVSVLGAVLLLAIVKIVQRA